MSFLKLTTEPKQPQISHSWLADEPETKKVGTDATLQKEGLKTKENELAVLRWDYPELNNRDFYENGETDIQESHVFASNIKKLIMNSANFGNYIDTVWMCMKFNLRFNLFEVLIPECFRDDLGGRTRMLIGRSLSKNEVSWSLVK